LSAARPSEWETLFDIAITIFDHFHSAHGYVPQWSFGGGTAIMLQIDHRESHDVDLFLGDPQILPYLNPRTQGITLSRQSDSYETDGTGFLKLAYKDMGEIDFVCCGSITDNPTKQTEVRGQTVALETPAEIIAKKVHFRGARFLPRDMFDLAAVAEHCGSDYVITALSQCGRAACEKTLGVIDRMAPTLVEPVISQLMLREATRHLVGQAQGISRDLLKQALLVSSQ